MTSGRKAACAASSRFAAARLRAGSLRPMPDDDRQWVIDRSEDHARCPRGVPASEHVRGNDVPRPLSRSETIYTALPSG